MIDGVKVKKLAVHPDERGRLMEMLRSDDPFFEKFGQVYVTATYPGVVKAWHKHEKQSDNMACVSGMVKLALYDARKGSPTHGEVNQFYMGIHNPILVHIPAGVYHGWLCISEAESLVVNCPTERYDYDQPDEQRLDPHTKDIPYSWARRDG
ncbi:MAG: dTDP-4-dehydrorhamnose 3,5-epimerase [Candidatus Aminicenantes bacterium]|nr:dTDP-4-dehydrorhamnose 3,5-epimerase [Candidatus Aminicenantes bacterium]